MEPHIDITGIDRVALLVALYHGTRAVGLGMLNDRPGFNEETARAVLAAQPVRPNGDVWFDYVCGRPLKVIFSGDTLRGARLYDRDAYEGACQDAVNAAREGKQ